jgi:hypothetical protein
VLAVVDGIGRTRDGHDEADDADHDGNGCHTSDGCPATLLAVSS